MSNLLCTHSESSCARNTPSWWVCVYCSWTGIQSLWMETLSTQIDGKKKEKSTSFCWKYSPLEWETGYVHIKRMKSNLKKLHTWVLLLLRCDAIQLPASQTVCKQVTTISNFTPLLLANVSPRIKICLQGCVWVREYSEACVQQVQNVGEVLCPSRTKMHRRISHWVHLDACEHYTWWWWWCLAYEISTK